MQKLRQGMGRVLEAEESQDVLTQHDALVATLVDFEEAAYAAWAANVEETSAAKLRQPLLVRDGATQLLSVNFDPDLVRLLREVRYFSYLAERAVPAAAVSLGLITRGHQVTAAKMAMLQ